MLMKFGETQRKFLGFLLKRKSGVTLDEAAEELGVARTAAQQHLTALNQLGYLEPAGKNLTGGRPSQSYRLSEKGLELFPKQYSWFSELMLKAIHQEKGSEGLKDWLKTLASSVAKAFEDQMKPLSSDQKIKEVSKIMASLNYEAATKKKNPFSTIEASNCVFHALAHKYPEVCEFDLQLLRSLTGLNVNHETCMLSGSDSCKFSFASQVRSKKKITAEPTAENGDRR